MIFTLFLLGMRRHWSGWPAPKACLALVLCLLGTVQPALAARLALVIGNDQYTSIERLKNAKNDARLISGVLKQAGFEVTQASDLRRAQLWTAIDTFRGRINKGDEVVFYFAGHGVQIGANQLLLPTDIDAQSEYQLQRDGVPLVDVQDALKDARVAVLLIDACRDNPFPKQGTRSVGGTRGLTPPEPSTGQIIMMSAGRNQKALDTVPGQNTSNGLFTWELAQLLQTPGLDARAALLQVRDRVDDKAKAANHEQRPSVVDDLRGNFFFIAPGANVTIQVNQPPLAEPAPTGGRTNAPTTAPATPSRTQATDPESLFWAEVKTNGSRGYFDAYLKQYPKGKYVVLARLELKNIDEQDKAAKAREEAERTNAAEQLKTEQARADQAAWTQAKATDSVASYGSYLSAYPQGRFAALAELAKQRVQSQATQREEAALWQSAQSGGKAPLQAYLSRYPGGQYASAANKRLEEIKAEEAKCPQIGQTFKDCAECPEMVVLPTGSFTMGSTKNGSEGPAHIVTIAQTFALGKFTVTQGQWKAVMGSNPSGFPECGDYCPVESVSWNDAQTFIQKLNANTGKAYRLPSEAEWEYACRAGGSHEYCGSDSVGAVGWHVSNNGFKTHSVGGKQANAWGLYDMSGNVYQWMQDWHHDNYNGAPTEGSAWQSGGEQKFRVIRGGSWDYGPAYLRSAARSRATPDNRDYYFGIGFRLARTVP